jgi:hypothetical protein
MKGFFLFIGIFTGICLPLTVLAVYAFGPYGFIVEPVLILICLCISVVAAADILPSKPTKLSVGDRVKVYGLFSPSEGGSTIMLNGRKGTVINTIIDTELEIDLDKPFKEPYIRYPHRIDCVHPKQCRRLARRTK